MSAPATGTPPRPTLPAWALGTAAFCGGFGLMMLEILGGRLMAPQFGYSVYQWGAVIGVVMAFMAAGYWMGGTLGDGRRALPALRAALALAALWGAGTPWVAPPLLDGMGFALPPQEGSVIAAAVLLAVPSFALAMVSPICAGLTALSGAAAAGRVYAVGTVGSIAGTFAAAFWAIPAIGVTAGYGVAALVLAAGLVAAARAVAPAAGAGVAALATLLAGPGTPAGYALVRETPHNTIYVAEDSRELRLHLNVPWAVQSRVRKDGGPTGLYYDLFPALPLLAQGRRVLVLGMAGGAAATGIRAAWPDAAVLGVELDAAVVEVARERFGLDPAVPVLVEDARRYVTHATDAHDVIVIDLYNTVAIPFFVATREFFQLVERRLAPGGIVAMNVAAPADRDALVGPLAATMAAAFPAVFAADAGNGNHFLLAAKEPRTAQELLGRLRAAPSAVKSAALDLADTLAPAETAGFPVLTDDRTDIDLRSLRALYGR